MGTGAARPELEKGLPGMTDRPVWRCLPQGFLLVAPFLPQDISASGSAAKGLHTALSQPPAEGLPELSLTSPKPPSSGNCTQFPAVGIMVGCMTHDGMALDPIRDDTMLP